MTTRRLRTLTIALLLTALALPAAALPARQETAPSLLVQIWERLAAPFAAWLDATTSDGRSVWDPNGLNATPPAGTENVVALVKSAVAAANNAYESVHKAAKQAADVAEANFQAVTTTAVKATQAAGKTKRAA